MRTSLLALLATILSCGDDITNNYYYSDEGDEAEAEAEAEAESESESESESEAEAEAEGETPEICDGLDNNGDGLADENFPGLGEACDGLDNNSCTDGIIVCNANGDATVCDDNIVDPYFETCNGLDDDCDGVIDNPPEPLKGFEYCGGKVGVCVDAELVCAEDGSWVCEFPRTQGDELCTDGLDNNCDGYTDCGTFECGPCEPEGWEGEAEAEAESEGEEFGEIGDSCVSYEDCAAGLECVSFSEEEVYCTTDCTRRACPEGWECRVFPIAPFCVRAEGASCASVMLKNGEMIEVDGEPNFALAPSSPTGTAVPGVTAVMRFLIAADGCDDLIIDELHFRVDFTDNAESGWQPGEFTLINMASPELAIPATMVERSSSVFLVTVSTYLYVPVGVSVMIEARLGTIGVSSTFDDALLVTLQNPVRWRVDEPDSLVLTTLEETLPIAGDTLIF